jgi:hypothetical protein
MMRDDTLEIWHEELKRKLLAMLNSFATRDMNQICEATEALDSFVRRTGNNWDEVAKLWRAIQQEDRHGHA